MNWNRMYSIIQPITRNKALTKVIVEKVAICSKNRGVEDQMRLGVQIAIESVRKK